jgi:hypothetical protein
MSAIALTFVVVGVVGFGVIALGLFAVHQRKAGKPGW